MREINKLLNRFDGEGNLRKSKVNVGYVDIYTDEGELIKHAFDIEYIPNMLFVRDGKVYRLPKTITESFGMFNTVSNIQDFILKDYKDAPYDLVQPGVSSFNLFYEYLYSYIAERKFEQIMNVYI